MDEAATGGAGDDVAVWVDGRLVGDAPAIRAMDHGVTVGDGAFETAKIVDGQVLALSMHHDRMDRSLAGLGLPPADRGLVEEGIRAVVSGREIPFGRVRWTVTAGPGPMGSDRLDGAQTTIVVGGPVARPAAATTIALVPWTRNERSAVAGLKTTSYAENVIALAAAKRCGATEAILTNTRGELCEGTGSNLFLVSSGVLRTPEETSGLLPGITRALVLRWAAEAGLETREETLLPEDLAAADEVFITSSTRDAQAVERVVLADGVPAGWAPCARELPAPGPVTRRVSEIFSARESELLGR